MLPLQIFMANYMNTMSIPAYLVPKGGFITTKSTDFGLQLIDLISALTSSNDPPYNFSSSTYWALFTYF